MFVDLPMIFVCSHYKCIPKLLLIASWLYNQKVTPGFKHIAVKSRSKNISLKKPWSYTKTQNQGSYDQPEAQPHSLLMQWVIDLVFVSGRLLFVNAE